MTSALIITTYNWKEALELVLLSLLQQSEMPDEIIIADDGSREDTQAFIDSFKKKTSLPIIHSWQEDKGFRAAESRNKAIAHAKSDYIILIDGDMILHPDFMKEHKREAKKGFFIQGSRVLLDLEKSREAIEKKIVNFSPFEKGVKNRFNALHSKILSSLFLSKSESLRGIKTCNMSFFRDDFYKINGFNNAFIGWGREDSEFIVRMYNSGIKRLQLKFQAVAYHIWHNENIRDSLPVNDALLEEAIELKSTFCSDGVEKFKHSDGFLT